MLTEKGIKTLNLKWKTTRNLTQQTLKMKQQVGKNTIGLLHKMQHTVNLTISNKKAKKNKFGCSKLHQEQAVIR